MMPYLTARLFNTPLMIARAKLETVLAVLRPKLAGGIVPAANALQQRSYEVTPDGVAIIPIFGTLVRRAYGLMAQSGLTTYTEIAQQFDAAVNDQSVRAILLDIDSPGGDAAGVFDLAEKIYAARATKPVWAIADEESFSAAYLLAAAAEKIYLPRTGGVGSIGVIAVHLDQSQADENDGLSYTAVFAGERKNDFTPHAPLSDPARTTLQTEINRVYEMFVQSVARMRGITPDSVKATEAGLFFGEAAIAARLADAIGTFDDALLDLAARIKPATPTLIQTKQRKENRMLGELPENDLQLDQPTLDLAAIRNEAMAYVTDVTQLCQLAGQPDKAAAFIAKATPVENVRAALLESRAAADEANSIANQVPASTNPTSEPKIDTAAIYAERNKRKAN